MWYTLLISSCHIPIDSLEVQSNLHRQRTWSDKVRSAEGRQEVIQRILIGDIHRSQVQVHLVAFLVKDVVLTDAGVEEAAGGYARRIVVVVLRDAGLRLLIVGEPAQVNGRRRVGGEGHRPGHQPRVVAPVTSRPKPVQRPTLGELILHVCGFIEFLVVIDAERQAALPHGCAQSAHLRREEAGRHAG